MNNTNNLCGIILAGGSGTRLWPMSSEAYPKQLLNLTGDKSLLQLTWQRLSRFITPERLITITNNRHVSAVKQQLGNAHKAIGEPAGRNTAPAVALGIRHIREEYGDDPIIMVCPSDHLIKNEETFQNAALKGIELAENGRIITFGIKPTRTETGYGYIQASTGKFREKPDYDTALRYIQSGDYYWNGGIFMFKLSTITEELEKFVPEILRDIDDYEKLPSISIDYAVMEKSSKISVIPVDCGWSDLGSWEAVYDVLEKDNEKNAVKGDVITLNTKDSLIYSTSRTVATIGVRNIVVVETPDAVLVCNKDDSQAVKMVLNRD